MIQLDPDNLRYHNGKPESLYMLERKVEALTEHKKAHDINDSFNRNVGESDA